MLLEFLVLTLSLISVALMIWQPQLEWDIPSADSISNGVPPDSYNGGGFDIPLVTDSNPSSSNIPPTSDDNTFSQAPL